MNREDIIRWAREAGDVEKDSRGRETFSFDCYGVERFAQIVADAAKAEEREQAVQPSRQAWRGLTDEDIENAKDEASIQFRKSRYRVRGQQIIPGDSLDWWIARVIETTLKERNE